MSGKYKEWLTDSNLKRLQEWGKKGLTNSLIAYNIGISERTLYTWINEHKEISVNLQLGKDLADKEIENALYKRALGYEINEEKTYIEENNGKIKKRKEITTKHIPGNVTAQICWLRNRKRKEWTKGDSLE